MNFFHQLAMRFAKSFLRKFSRSQIPDFFLFMQGEQVDMRQQHRFSTAEKYGTALAHLKRFYGQPQLYVCDIDAEMMKGFENYLDRRAISRNSTSAYMRSLSACYNRAVKQYGLENKRPFVDVYTGVAKTRKRAVDYATIKKIAELNLDAYPHRAFVRDIFLFSFYMRGMSLVDVVFLTFDNWDGRYIHYNRRKTGQHFVVYLEEPAYKILLRYGHREQGHYLFPVISSTHPAEVYRQYRTFLYNYNRNLLKISQMVGRLSSSERITGYVARHSWATIARDSGVPTAVISSALGHSGEGTTQIYLDNMKNTVVDAANHKVVVALMKGKPSLTTKEGKRRKRS